MSGGDVGGSGHPARSYSGDGAERRRHGVLRDHPGGRPVRAAALSYGGDSFTHLGSEGFEQDKELDFAIRVAEPGDPSARHAARS
ncbi:MAG: hypothetical protein HY704_17025 [Gemmatimonadetes bacterium]|nr:hypothetical protein [Gemmatimonadota bacterium]